MASTFDMRCWNGRVLAAGYVPGAAVNPLGGTCAPGCLPVLQRI